MSGWSALMYVRIEKLSDTIGGELWIVEDALAAIISPEAREFSVTEVIAEHGYPDVDLRIIDLDWT